jgi:hypothetical protein
MSGPFKLCHILRCIVRLRGSVVVSYLIRLYSYVTDILSVVLCQWVPITAEIVKFNDNLYLILHENMRIQV